MKEQVCTTQSSARFVNCVHNQTRGLAITGLLLVNLFDVISMMMMMMMTMMMKMMKMMMKMRMRMITIMIMMMVVIMIMMMLVIMGEPHRKHLHRNCGECERGLPEFW